MNPLISIIIPCYNHGQHLQAALDSARALHNIRPCEIWVIDDGSTDAATIAVLDALEKEHDLHIIRQPNGGPSAARNHAIRQCAGTYILPLDADNRLHSEAFAETAALLDGHPDVDIIYGDYQLTGEREGIVKSGPFNLQRLMLDNFIDVCSIYRRTVWEVVGGYDESFRGGLEDWEFWLHAAFKGCRFHYEPKVAFDYQVLAASRTSTLISGKRRQDLVQQIIEAKHPGHYGPQFVDADMMKKFRRSPLGFVGKLFLMTYLPHQFRRLVHRGRLRNHL